MNSSSLAHNVSHFEAMTFALMTFSAPALAAESASAPTHSTADFLLQVSSKHRFTRAIQALRRL